MRIGMFMPRSCLFVAGSVANYRVNVDTKKLPKCHLTAGCAFYACCGGRTKILVAQSHHIPAAPSTLLPAVLIQLRLARQRREQVAPGDQLHGLWCIWKNLMLHDSYPSVALLYCPNIWAAKHDATERPLQDPPFRVHIGAMIFAYELKLLTHLGSWGLISFT